MRLEDLFLGPVRKLRSSALDRLRAERAPIQLVDDHSDKATKIKAADTLFERRQREHALGTIGRSRLLLRIIENTFPSERLTDEYFQNMEILLHSKPVRSSPGKVLLGIGSGRTGSTSLAALLSTIEDSCCTHENPPLIDWSPDEAQVQFHMRRLKLLSKYYSTVADVSHWWLNALDHYFECFPDGKVVGLFRDIDSCSRSFMKIKGKGRRSSNHWAPRGNGLWRSTVWDVTYPSYPVPENALRQLDRAKYEMIRRYVEGYNTSLRERAAREPHQIVLIQTELLGDPAMQKLIFDLVEAPVKLFNRKLNVRNVADGESDEFII